MRFSIICPSRLIPYKGCASFLDRKIVRAIDSVIDQTFPDWELIIISDECQSTVDIVAPYVLEDSRIRLLQCKHKALFDNTPRNTGIDNAKGKYITYLDVDDFLGSDHLKLINEQLKEYDWVWYNDYIYSEKWIERACNIKALGGSGTSNVCHKVDLGIRWGRPGYAHDYYFNQQLLRFKNGAKINTPEYFVMHIPGITDL